MLKARWIGPRWMKALVKMRHHSPAATAKALMRLASPIGPTPPPKRPPLSVSPCVRTASMTKRTTQMAMIVYVTNGTCVA